jgi:hypothetical protein
MRTIFKLSSGLALLGAVASTSAQSTFNYFVSDAGGGNSLVTWDATGSITTSLGAIWTHVGGFGGLQVSTPGIYVDAYAGSGIPQSIPTPDGSYFHNSELDQDFPIRLYFAENLADSSNDSFALLSSSVARMTGQHIIYDAGTQSAFIPVPFSSFNPGTYQSVYPAGTFLDSATTVNLTVGAVPEPSTMTFFALGGLLLFCRRKVSFGDRFN